MSASSTSPRIPLEALPAAGGGPAEHLPVEHIQLLPSASLPKNSHLQALDFISVGLPSSVGHSALQEVPCTGAA